MTTKEKRVNSLFILMKFPKNGVLWYLYQNGGYLQSITSPSGTQYNFLYDEFYQNTEIRVGEQSLSTNICDEEGKITKTTYGNGEYIIGFYFGTRATKE